jgi:hypothetical protein
MYGINEIKHILPTKQIKEATKKEVEDALKDALRYAVADSGFKMHEDDAKYLQIELLKLISHKYHYLRLQEIKIAFRNGVQKKYGEFMGLSLATFSQFLNFYVSSSERVEAIKSITIPVERQIEEKPFNIVEYGEWLYQQFLEKGEIYDITNAYYYYLTEQGKINLSIEEKHMLIMEAEHNLIAEKQKVITDLASFKECDKLIQQIEQGKKKDLIKSRAMRLALKNYFITLKNKQK